MPTPSRQARILQEFVPGTSPITVAADPDSLLQDERILTGLWERGFVLLRFEDPIAFRYAYEGMTMTAYPFWGAVAEYAGRLLRHPGLFPTGYGNPRREGAQSHPS